VQKEQNQPSLYNISYINEKEFFPRGKFRAAAAKSDFAGR
jgi:hypothetical protein